MPLPQKVVDRLTQGSVTTPGLAGQLLLFSGTLFLIGLFVYGGIVFGYRPYFERQRKSLNDKIQAFVQEIPATEQDKIISFYSQLENIRNLLDRRVSLSAFFAWLERVTQQNVYFRQLSIDVPSGKVNFVGVAKNLTDVEEQLAIFERIPEIQSAAMDRASFTNDKTWEFSGTLLLLPSVFVATSTLSSS